MPPFLKRPEGSLHPRLHGQRRRTWRYSLSELHPKGCSQLLYAGCGIIELWALREKKEKGGVIRRATDASRSKRPRGEKRNPQRGGARSLTLYKQTDHLGQKKKGRPWGVRYTSREMSTSTERRGPARSKVGKALGPLSGGDRESGFHLRGELCSVCPRGRKSKRRGSGSSAKSVLGLNLWVYRQQRRRAGLRKRDVRRRSN